MHRCLGAGRPRAVIEAQQKFGRGNRRYRSDFGEFAATGCRSFLRTGIEFIVGNGGGPVFGCAIVRSQNKLNRRNTQLAPCLVPCF